MGFGRGVFCLFLVSGTSGCAVLDEEDAVFDGEEGELDELESPASPKGMSLNGMSLNGVHLNGMSLNGMSLNGMSLNGMSLNGMSLNGSELTGFDANGQSLSGAELVGAQMSGELAGGGTLRMRVDSAAPLASPNADVWAYGMSYARADGTWSPLCVEGDTPALAVFLSGLWNYGSGVPGGGSWTASSTSFTLGCRGAALAKCVELGYKPWQSLDGEVLADHHQACSRMIRADYCGDGKSWTRDGTAINLYDDLGIQLDATNWHIDAEWLPSGSRCIHKLRDFQDGRPSCWERKRGDCGTFENGALLIDEYKKK